MRQTPPGCRAFSSMYIPRLSSFKGKQSIHTYPTTNSSTLSLGKCVHAMLSRTLRRLSFVPEARIRSRPRISRRFGAMSPVNEGNFNPRHVRVCWRSKNLRSERGNMIQLGLNSGRLASRGIATTEILATNHLRSYDYEAETTDGPSV